MEGWLGSTKGKQRSILSGGGRKPSSAKLEELLLEWIENRRAMACYEAKWSVLEKKNPRYVAQQDPDRMVAKLVSHVIQVKVSIPPTGFL